MGRIIPATASFVDPACPINWDHLSNQGLVADYTIVPNPGWRGGLTLRDLVRGGKNPNDGTLMSMATGPGVSGWNGGAGRAAAYGSLAFDAINDYVSVPNSPNLQPTTGIGLFAWFKTSRTGNYQQIFCKAAAATWASPYAVWALRITNANQLEAWVNNGASPGNLITSVTTVTDGKWHHAGFAFNGTVLNIYLDGTLNTTKNLTAALSTSTFPLNIGFSQSGDTSFFGGSLDGLQVYNRAPTAQEIQALYLETKRGNSERYNWYTQQAYSFPSGGTNYPDTGIARLGAKGSAQTLVAFGDTGFGRGAGIAKASDTLAIADTSQARGAGKSFAGDVFAIVDTAAGRGAGRSQSSTSLAAADTATGKTGSRAQSISALSLSDTSASRAALRASVMESLATASSFVDYSNSRIGVRGSSQSVVAITDTGAGKTAGRASVRSSVGMMDFGIGRAGSRVSVTTSLAMSEIAVSRAAARAVCFQGLSIPVVLITLHAGMPASRFAGMRVIPALTPRRIGDK